MVVCYQLCLTTLDNLITWDSATLMVCLMAGYDIDFAAIIRYELYERALVELTTFLDATMPT